MFIRKFKWFKFNENLVKGLALVTFEFGVNFTGHVEIQGWNLIGEW